jgi:penicillin amidase
LYKKLASWDYKYEENNTSSLLYQDLFREIYNNTFDEVLGYRDTLDVLLPEDWVMVDLLKNKSQSFLFDIKSTTQKESMKDVIQYSFEKITNSKNIKNYSKPWGSARPVHIDHFTRIPALSVKDISTGGYPDCINAMNKSFGPSWRMAVELGEKTIAYGIYPGGQSGNPLSKFYKNNIEKWAKNEYYTLNNEKDPAKIKSIKTITATK